VACQLTRFYRADTTTAVLATLDEKISSIASETTAAKLRQEDHERVIQANLKEVYDKQKDKGLGGMMGRRGTLQQMANFADKDVMNMDVDDPPDYTKGKNRKCVPSSSSSHSEILTDGFPRFVWVRASQEANPKPQRKRNKF
jgi:COP9 signalosome complex subunit 7